MSENSGERIAKVMARAGLCSRREAERWIAEGRVSIDGQVLTSPAVTVTAESIVLVDGAPLPAAAETRLWRYHKPPGLVTSHGDPQGRPTTVTTAVQESDSPLSSVIVSVTSVTPSA